MARACIVASRVSSLTSSAYFVNKIARRVASATSNFVSGVVAPVLFSEDVCAAFCPALFATTLPCCACPLAAGTTVRASKNIADTETLHQLPSPLRGFAGAESPGALTDLCPPRRCR